MAARMTKTQLRRMVRSIESKAWRLAGYDMGQYLSIDDVKTIQRIMKKTYNKLK